MSDIDFSRIPKFGESGGFVGSQHAKIHEDEQINIPRGASVSSNSATAKDWTDLDEGWIKQRYEEAASKNGPPKGVMMFGGKPGHSYKIERNTTGRVFYGTADENGTVEAKF